MCMCRCQRTGYRKVKIFKLEVKLASKLAIPCLRKNY